ncbi:MAG TPA: S8 family serine peptidase, partial [Ardenticatenaceae bacterium]|nr:S8 family serine peptidase [Ardenticatenaceae bacterium]
MLSALLALLFFLGAALPPAVRADDPASSSLEELVARTQGGDKVPVIVGLKVGFEPEGNLAGALSVQTQRLNIAAAQTQLLRRLGAFDIGSVTRFKYIPYLALELDAGALAALAADPDVSSIVEDRLVRPELAESGPLVGAPAAWASGYTGAGWSIAVLDTGVDSGHPFLAGKVVSEACFSKRSGLYDAEPFCPNGNPTQVGPGAGINCPADVDGCTHGTHVAGIAAGRGDSFSGIARDANLIAIQVFTGIYHPYVCGGEPLPCIAAFNSDIVAALEHVYELRGSFNIAAVNMSLGGVDFTSPEACEDHSEIRPFKVAIDNLRSVGIASVVASGNDGKSNAISGPACIRSAISVGSTNKSDNVSSFSNGAWWLQLLAPGASIRSSVVGGGYANFSGTSMATPHVAGAWAVIKSKAPDASVDEVLAALRNSGVPVTDERKGVTTSRIEINAALQAWPFGAIETPAAAPTLGGVLRLSGWASVGGAAIDRVEIWIDGIYRGNATYGTPRPGLGGDFGFFWDWNTTLEANGPHNVQVRVVASNGRSALLPWAGGFASPINVQNPVGYVETPSPSSTLNGIERIGGWTLVGGSAISRVEIWIDGVLRGEAVYGTPRPGLGGNYGYYW